MEKPYLCGIKEYIYIKKTLHGQHKKNGKAQLWSYSLTCI